MAVWVEQDAYVVLRLDVGEGRAELEGPADARLEIVGLDVEVLGRVLDRPSCSARSAGCGSAQLEVQRSPEPAGGRICAHSTADRVARNGRIIGGDRLIEQAGVEVREVVGL